MVHGCDVCPWDCRATLPGRSPFIGSLWQAQAWAALARRSLPFDSPVLEDLVRKVMRARAPDIGCNPST